MSTTSPHPDPLFERPYRLRGGYTHTRRVGIVRRWVTFLVLLFLLGLIGGYLYITESKRVRGMAEAYLTGLLGADVDMSSARLSLFEGLRLDDVVVRTDKNSTSPESVIFTAHAFIINYDPTMLLRGELRATRIVAVNPHVRLTENLDTRTWNYQRLFQPTRKGSTRPTGMPSRRPEVLPEILLRDALLDYAEISNGVYRSVGTLAVEGQLTPGDESGLYTFDVRSRGLTEATGPEVSGSFNLDNGTVVASLRNFKFGRDLKSVLPAQVRKWCEDHQLDGRLNVRELSYHPGASATDGTVETEARFMVETDLDGVTLAVNPLQMTGTPRIDVLQDSVGLLDLTLPYAPGLVDRIETLREPVPIRLRKVAGTFVFTEAGISVKDMVGQIENNWMRVNGSIGGYTPDAPFDLTLASLASENIVIPKSPRYVRGLPLQVREIYDKLRPEGACSLWVRMVRKTPGGRPAVSGEVDVVDGTFAFEMFPYPIRRATGKISFGVNPDTGRDMMRLINIRGHGAIGGPNENADIFVDGIITPLDDKAGVNIRVRGENISSEPALTHSFPRPVREALTVFDPEGRGQYPTYAGRFECDIIRPIGWRMPWTINVDIDLKTAAGRLVPFPYPLSGVSGRLEIREGYVDIKQASMKRGDGTLVFDGRVRWGKKHEPVRTDLTITARNTPIDQDLINALPPAQRAWLSAVGMKGTIDIDGRVWPRELGNNAVETDYQFDVNLRDGTACPVDDQPTVTGLNGLLRLTPQKLQMLKLAGRRGESVLSSDGWIAWPNDVLSVDLTTRATDLKLDASLYKALPEGARAGWDAVKPQGSVDATLVVRTDPAVLATASVTASLAPGDQLQYPPPAFELTLIPRDLTVTPDALPVKLSDVKGNVVVTRDRVTLTDVTARRGEATLSVSGVGTLGDDPVWDLKIAGEKTVIDKELLDALPPALSEVLRSIDLTGRTSYAFSKLVYKPNAPSFGATQPVVPSDVAQRPATLPAPGVDVDFACRIETDGATMQVGVPLSDVRGRLDLSGAVRDGRVSELSGQIDVPTLSMAGRKAQRFSATLSKPRDLPALQISKMQGELAGGSVAGQIDVVYPDDGPSRYAMSVVLHEADIRELAGPSEQDVSGRLNASLALEGSWVDIKSRRGRGDVQVSGKDMYRIPVVLGLLEIANLSLPINSPFSEGSARYGVEGERITLEQIELRSQNMLMQGSGFLDFGTKQVRLKFTTDNPNWPKIPLVGDLIQSARSELLQIHVKGTLTDPKVSAGTFNTVTTTVDEVLKGDGE